MRSLFIAVLLLLNTLLVSAQTKKGDYLIGVNVLSISNPIVGVNNYANISIHPSLGYFVRDNFLIGSKVRIGAGVQNRKVTVLNYGVNPFIRKYFSKTESRTKIFAEALIGFNGSYITSDGNKGFHNTVQASLMGGLAYFISRDVSLEATTGIQAITSTLGLGIEYKPSLNVGFQVYLNRKSCKWNQPDLH